MADREVEPGFPRLKGEKPNRVALRKLRASVTRSYASPKVRRAQRDLARASKAVKARSAGRCEAEFVPSCERVGVHAHHRLPRSRGGPHTARNLLWVCLRCHDQIHAHPDVARSRFLLLSASDAVAVEILQEAARLRAEELLS
jgi:hypothetical protein